MKTLTSPMIAGGKQPVRVIKLVDMRQVAFAALPPKKVKRKSR